MKHCLAATSLFILVATSLIYPSQASQLSPTGTAEERKASNIRGSWVGNLGRYVTTWGVVTFGEPVHEEITDRIFGCDGDICRGLPITRAPVGVIAGVRWNDDPPFMISSGEGRGTSCKVVQTIRFITQPRCWYELFRDAEKRAAGGEQFTADTRSALLYRTHFGDLQYLHAMAAADGEAATRTRQRILDWVEFNWGILLGEFRLDTSLASVDIATIHESFSRTVWTVQDLYTLGSPGLRPHIRDMAFGSILHQLQDSFAQGHTERAGPSESRMCSAGGFEFMAPGEIREFHSYVRQDHALHKQADSRGAFQEHLMDEPDVVEIGRILKKAYERRLSWQETKPLFECIYALSDQPKHASPGDQFALAH